MSTSIEPDPPGVLSGLTEWLGRTGVQLHDTFSEADVASTGLPVSSGMPDPAEWPAGVQLLGEIARGGMGVVLRGRDPDLGRELAVKVLLEEYRDHPGMHGRFIEEAQIGGQLQHPGIVPVYELGAFADKRPYFTMKLVRGRTLAALLKDHSNSSYDRPRLLGIFEAICQTMAYAHSMGVIHRDLKPANVMIGSFGEVQVMDWGLAKVLATGRAGDERGEVAISTARSRADTSPAGSVLGTPAYMAPEQARGELDRVDQRADVFGLGAILCELITGKPSFTGESVSEVIRKAMSGDLSEALARLDACGADRELLDLARSCLAADPAERPGDAKVVADRMTAYQQGVQDRLRAAELARVEAQARTVEERKRRRVTVALAATILIAGALGAAGWRWRELDRLARAESATRRVNTALQQAMLLRGLARGAAVGDLAPWADARGAAEKASALLEPGVDPEVRTQADLLLAEVVTAQEQAARAARAAAADRRLLQELDDARTASAEDLNGAATEAAYQAAFRQAGLDLDTMPAAEAAAKIRVRPPAVASGLTAALDDWAGCRRFTRYDYRGAARLIAAARAADPDPWRDRLRQAMDQPGQAPQRGTLRELGRSAQPADRTAGSLNLLGNVLILAGEYEAAEDVLRRAQRRYPGDVLLNYDLGRALERRGRRADAIRYYTAARALRPESAHKLAHVLQGVGEVDEAIAVFDNLHRLRPAETRHLRCLGDALVAGGRKQEAAKVFDDAIAAARGAINLDPRDFNARLNLVGLLSEVKHDYDASLAEGLTLVQLVPDDHVIRASLGTTLSIMGRLDEAIAAFREAIRLQPDYAEAHEQLGGALGDTGRIDEAFAALREAIRLRPDSFSAHYTFGALLGAAGRQAEAIEEYRETIRLQPDLAEAHCNLGILLRTKGLYVEALAQLQQGHKLGIKRLDWRYPSAEWVRQAQQMVALDAKLPAIRKGKAQPADAAERLVLAQMCYDQAWHAEAAQFWSEAFASNPGLVADPQAGYRYNAACSAALAGCGRSKDNPPVDDAAKVRLRRQSVQWLKADLALLKPQSLSDSPEVRAVFRQKLLHWLADADLAGIRDPDALVRLPDDERAACKALWGEVNGLLAKTNGDRS